MQNWRRVNVFLTWAINCCRALNLLRWHVMQRYEPSPATTPRHGSTSVLYLAKPGELALLGRTNRATFNTICQVYNVSLLLLHRYMFSVTDICYVYILYWQHATYPKHLLLMIWLSCRWCVYPHTVAVTSRFTVGIMSNWSTSAGREIA